MTNKIPMIPEMEVGLLVVTPTNCKNITANKKYAVKKLGDEEIYLRNDIGEVHPYSSYQFIEADLYFTMCLFSTVIRIFKLGNKAYK